MFKHQQDLPMLLAEQSWVSSKSEPILGEVNASSESE